MDTPALPRNAAPEAAVPAGWAVVAVIAVGGATGAMGRHGIDVLLPATDRGFPLGTFLVNVTGCLVLGALAGTLFRPGAHRLLRAFVAVGVLGGFTTFSTYTVATVDLALDAEVGTAFGYLIATVAAALLAVEGGMTLSRYLSYRRRRGRSW